MKKVTAILFAFLMSASLYGCNDKENNSEENSSADSSNAINIEVGTGGNENDSDETAEPENITEGGFIYSVNEDDSISITGYTGSDSDLKIPDKINGADVTSIENYAFQNMEFIENVSVPDTIEKIGYQAFDGTKYIQSLQNDEFIVIGKSLYLYNGDESSVTIPENVNSISPNAFMNNISVKEVTIKSNISEISNSAFTLCQSLEKVTIEEGVTAISSAAFSSCKALKSIELPSTLKSIGTAAFSSCTSLETINLPDGIETIDDRAFEDCTALSDIKLPDSVTYIGYCTFLDCESLTEINLPENLTAIYSLSFKNCTGIKSIVIPEKVETIYAGAFSGCTNLETIEIPETVTNLVIEEDEYRDNIFTDCNKVKIITPAGSKAEEYAIEMGIECENK